MEQSGVRTLIESGSPRKLFRVRLDQFHEQRVLDLRYWYYDKASSEVRPTGKGIAITSRNYLDLCSVVTDFHLEIMNHLGVETGDQRHPGNIAIATDHHSQMQVPVSEIEVKIEPMSPPSELYRVVYEGALAIVKLNSTNPVVSSLSIENFSMYSEGRLLALALVSLDQTLNFSFSSESGEKSYLLDQIKYEFLIKLSKLSRKVA